MRTQLTLYRFERSFVLFLIVMTAWASSTAAQTPSGPIDDSARVTTLASAAAGEARRLAAQSATVERWRNDPVLNGALIGAAAGVAGGLLLCRTMEPWEVCNDPGPLLRYGAVGAGIGIGIDALIRKREVVPVRGGSAQLSVVPMAGRGAKGVQLGVRF